MDSSLDTKTTITLDFFRFHKLASWLYAFVSRKSSVSKTDKLDRPAKGSDRDGSEGLNREEMRLVMGKLGVPCSKESEESLPMFASAEEMSKLFEERPACAAEVKGAFDVFDVNGDGFIDVGELQRVLCVLGLKEGEGEGVENCRRMIRKFDHNGDGNIDFDEFLNLMESVN